VVLNGIQLQCGRLDCIQSKHAKLHELEMNAVPVAFDGAIYI
jgi:hypothetical protein